MGWPWLSLRPMLGDTDMAALTDTATDTTERGPLTPAPMLGVTDMAAPTATVTDTDTDMARGPLMPSLLLLLRPSLRLRPMPTMDTALVSMATTLTATDSPMLATDTDTIMARGPLTPMPGDTDTAAHTDTATDTDTDTMARGPLMPMPGDTDTAAHTDTDTATGTDTLMASKLPPNLVACYRTPMSSKYLSHSC